MLPCSHVMRESKQQPRVGEGFYQDGPRAIRPSASKHGSSTSMRSCTAEQIDRAQFGLIREYTLKYIGIPKYTPEYNHLVRECTFKSIGILNVI